MKITQFEASGLHGYLNFHLDFRPDLVFLTGINGAGKTSAVRSMTALLAPSLTTLVSMVFQTIAVTVEHEGQSVVIEARQTQDEVLLRCVGISEPMQIPILRPERFETRTSFATRMRSFYSDQLAVLARHPTMTTLDLLPTPMFLDLERRYQEGSRQRNDVSRPSARIPSNPLAGSLIEGLEEAGHLAERAFRRYSAVRTEITDSLKQEIILAAFKRPEGMEQFSAPIPSPARRKDFLKKLGNSESVILPSLHQIGIAADRIERTVLPFFEEVREAVNNLPSEKEFRSSGNVFHDETLLKNLQRWSSIQPQVRQIDALVDLVAKYNDDLLEKFAPIRRYLESVNGFLEDSDKKIGFDTSGSLKVRINEPSGPQAVSALSSGERQLVVILTHLAFNEQAKRANVLIIDEPELSLHLRWQELFVDAVMSASPGIQLILATHSPSIIKGRIDHCIDVRDAMLSPNHAREAAQ